MKVYEQNDFVVDDVLNKSGYDTLHQGAPSELVLIETSRLIWSPAEAKSLPATVTPSGTPGVLPTEGLVAYYPLNGNTDDKSKYRNNGRVFGGVRDIPDGKRWVPNLDGSSGYVSAPDQPWLRVEQFTLAAWIYLKETTGHRRIIEKGNSNSYWFYLNHDRPLVGFYDGRH
jgi:hypothetical protein